jgi:hypothetical protein
VGVIRRAWTLTLIWVAVGSRTVECVRFVLGLALSAALVLGSCWGYALLRSL